MAVNLNNQSPTNMVDSIKMKESLAKGSKWQMANKCQMDNFFVGIGCDLSFGLYLGKLRYAR